MRTRAAALALAALLIAFAAPAAAGVRAFRTADGSEDADFVTLGARTTVAAVVPDGAHGVFLIGRIFADGGQRQIVHLAGGAVDPAFRLTVGGGQIMAGALLGHDLAIAWTFTSVGGAPRGQVAIADARTGRLRAWAPALPARPRVNVLSHLVVARSTLVVSTPAGLSAWRAGVARPVWTAANQPGWTSPAIVASWRGALWAVGAGAIGGLGTIDPLSGRARVVLPDFDHVNELTTIGGRLVVLSQGTYGVYGEMTYRSCGQATATQTGLVVTALAGDARTLYVGDDPITLDDPGSVPGVTACPWSGGGSAFRPPAFAYSVRGPIVSKIALVGTHVLAFTRPF